MGFRLGIDVGGTFTDLFLFCTADGAVFRFKTPSTPDDPSRAVLIGVTAICRMAGIEPAALDEIVHGTTVATNAVLEGKGARVGLVTTDGFRNVLHLARSRTPGPLAAWITFVKPDPPAALEDTVEIRERTGPRGEVIRPLDEAQAEQAIRQLAASGVEALAVSFLHSYANPSHERRVRAIAERVAPDLPVSVSSEILPEFREYERTVTTVMNSYVRPKVRRYLINLENSLRGMGMTGTLDILRSDAGLMSVQRAEQQPIQAALSGPSGGVAAAVYIANRAGYPNILTMDIGGTSTDVALCQDGAPSIARETEVGFFPMKVPSVDVRSVGAGGGSIAHVHPVTGSLRVGPESAGAVPGPACYSRGGSRPTVTDANLVLGYLPAQLLGGTMPLDVEASRRVVGELAQQVGLSSLECAKGIIDLTTEAIVGALRVVSVQRGYDPREFALLAFGGAGPLQANAVAKLLGSYPVIVPPSPGVLCAMGDLCCDYREEFTRTLMRSLGQLDAGELQGMLREMGEAARRWLEQEGGRSAQPEVTFYADMRYLRQGSELPVQIDPAEGDRVIADIEERYHQAHEHLYGFRMDSGAELVNLRAVALGRVGRPELPGGEPGSQSAGGVRVGEQQAYVEGRLVPVPIYDRGRLRPGNTVPGPCIVTENDSTTLVLEGHRATVDRYFNMLIWPDDSSTSR